MHLKLQKPATDTKDESSLNEESVIAEKEKKNCWVKISQNHRLEKAIRSIQFILNPPHRAY